MDEERISTTAIIPAYLNDTWKRDHSVYYLHVINIFKLYCIVKLYSIMISICNQVPIIKQTCVIDIVYYITFIFV